MKHLMTAMTLCLALGTQAQADSGFADAATLQSLRGTFHSSAPEPWYGGFGTREFVFNNGEWSLIFIHALDPAMTQRTFQFRTGGAYSITGPSAAVPGAYEATFDEDWKHLTLLTAVPEIAAGIGMADCNLTVNLEADVSETGCAAWKPVSVCGQDFDLLAMDADGVYFGQRPADNDMCTAERRPISLLMPVVPR